MKIKERKRAAHPVRNESAQVTHQTPQFTLGIMPGPDFTRYSDHDFFLPEDREGYEIHRKAVFA